MLLDTKILSIFIFKFIWNMEKAAPICPTITKALFIGSSAYQDATKVLPQTKLDIKAMHRFFQDHMEDFQSSYMLDKSKEQIEKIFKREFISCAEQAKDYKAHALFFIYYSGHGVLNGGETFGIAVDDSRICLD